MGRLSTAVLAGFGLLWIPLMQLISGQLYQYIQSVQAYIAPPIAAAFLAGVFWSRINSAGAMAALVTGFVLGLGRLVAEPNKDRLEGVLLGFASINFLHFAALLFAVCSAVLVVFGLATPRPPRERIEGLTYQTTAAAERPRVLGSEVLLSLVLVGAVIVLWLYFSD